MGFPKCSLIVVNYNGRKHIDSCVSSLLELNYPRAQREILVVDNGSDDGSDIHIIQRYPQVRLIRSPTNGFGSALNLGIAQTQGVYVAFLNNDVILDEDWLIELVKVLENDERVGCAGGKLLFENGRINSVGHRMFPDFFCEDEGFNEEDHRQYENEREVEGLCWAAILFRRKCLEEFGPIDEDYIMYYEDVDFSRRCRERGWKILYTPRALAIHIYRSSSHGTQLTEYFCDRGRLIFVAKHYPDSLPAAVTTSNFCMTQNWDALYETMPMVIKKLIDNHPLELVDRVTNNLSRTLEFIYGGVGVDHLFARMQVILGHRKMKVALYDHALNVIGGGQRYGCTIAAALQDKFEVTLIASKPVTLDDLERWYDLSLSKCQLKIIRLPFFDEYGSWIDSNVVTSDVQNPFGPIEQESQGYDVFINVNMLTMIRPLSPFSIFLCHFPDTPKRCYFSVDEYSCLICNSKYTAKWIKELWGLDPTFLLYPPVDMAAPAKEKENIILSVARFDPGGNKKQHELIRAFETLRSSEPETFRDWRLVLVGGSLPQNRYLNEIQHLAEGSPAQVEVLVNAPFPVLKDLYAKAKIFWHACGLKETNPHLIEHFGMTTVEAMQNFCVPIVIDGGGQREIVEHQRSGFRFRTIEELCRYTRKVASNPKLLGELAQGAHQRSQKFSRKRFEERVQELFKIIENEYSRVPKPAPRSILKEERPITLFLSGVARSEIAGGQTIWCQQPLKIISAEKLRITNKDSTLSMTEHDRDVKACEKSLLCIDTGRSEREQPLERPMRIGIDCSLIPGEKVGIGQYSFNLVKALSRVDRENKYFLYPIFYYIYNPEYKNTEFPNNRNFKIAFEYIPKDMLRFLWTKEAWPFSREFLLGKVDLVHSTTFCVPKFKGKKKRLVVTIYDLSFITHPECHMQANIDHCLQGTRDAVEHANAIIAISNHTKFDLIKYFDAPEDKIIVTHLAADETFTRIVDNNILERVRQKHSLPHDFILFVGSLEPRKNLRTLLRAYALLPQTFKNKFKLSIVGSEGWLNDQIKLLIEELKISDEVYITGYVAQEDLPAIYSMASVFVYPSLYEGFGLPILEAMACGTPVITSNVSSIPEVAGDAAVLIDPINEEELALAMERVLDDEDLRESLRIRGISRAKTFSWERCARETLEVYKRVMCRGMV